jgi:flagellin
MTNASAMTALKTLQATSKALEQTQARISTGLRVAEASDNAAYWSIATTMRSDNMALSTVQDALGLGAAKIDTAYTAINSAISVVDEIKAKLVAAREASVDRNKIQSEIEQLQNQLKGIAESASFYSENWLAVDSGSAGYNSVKEIVSSFTRAADGTVAVKTIEIDANSAKLFDADDQSGILDLETTTTVGTPAVNFTYSVSTLDISTLTGSADHTTVLDAMISWTDASLTKMTTSASDLGAAKKRINLQKDFVSALRDAIDRGIGQLVDADMNKESTRLQALQVQQQLGIQALSIANANAQGVLALFRS